MKTTTRTALLSLLITGLFASAAVSAAPMSPSSSNVQTGESESQVQSTLGKPDRVMHFGSETVWTYDKAPGLAGDDAVLQISFNQNGQINSVNVNDQGSE